MAKQSQIDKAITAIDLEISVLQAAKARLLQQQAKTPKRTPRPKVTAAPTGESHS